MTVVLVFLLNPGRSKDGIHKEGKHNTSAILSKLGKLVEETSCGERVGYMRYVPLDVLEEKK